MKIKINKYCLFIGVIIFFNLQGFYLLDANVFHTDDLSVVLELLFIFFELKGREKSTGKKYFSLLMLIPIILMFTSSFAAYISYGQPLWYGIRAQRAWIMAMLMYFPLVNLLRSKRISVDSLIKTLDFMVVIYIMLIILQYVLGSKLTFLHIGSSYRFNSIRLYASTDLIILSYFIHLKRILSEVKIKFLDVTIVFLAIFIHFFVTKSRMALFALVLCSLAAIVITHFSIRKLLIACIAFFAVITVMATSYGRGVLDSMFGEGAQDAGTIIRDVGRDFYIKEVTSSNLSTIIGKGYANLDWIPSVKGTRYSEGIYYNDNGIVGLIFYYGFIFVIWAIIIHVKAMQLSWRYSREYFYYFLCGLLGCYTLFPYCYSTDISFALVLAIVDNNTFYRKS